MTTLTCSVEGCDKKFLARNYCRTHYMRWSRHGDASIVRNIRGATCEIDNCGRIAKAHRYCDQHYKRFRRHGDPTVRLVAAIPEGSTYASIHGLVTRLHGPARLHECEHCGGNARDWAYDHKDANESYDSRGCPFSSNPERYMPLCRSCHFIFDHVGVKR